MMKQINANDATYELIELFGKPAIFSDYRISKFSVPEGLEKYEIRHNQEWEPATLENKVTVDFFGTVLIKSKFYKMDEKFVELTDTDIGYLDNQYISLQDYIDMDV